ncbi:rab2a member ras oncogene family [Anaeramoeba flamelloides]|uniref:Rab2a member ras oncogene family n=1 Tax=Anaeramoeba flamelloides TaxID=1746091 RepID=A0AAV8A0W8_9EUKA|nr:rab2a member ras oncogene family [Anaeramoeba flamelloides]
MGNSTPQRPPKRAIKHDILPIQEQALSEPIPLKYSNPNFLDPKLFQKQNLVWDEWYSTESVMDSLTLKILITGPSLSGKSSITQRVLNKPFPTEHMPTVGEERFRSVIGSYYRGAYLILLLFDLTNKKTFQELDDFIKLIKQENSTVPILIVGNKSDLVNSRQVETDEALEFAELHGLSYLESSAKTGDNLQIVFETLVNMKFDQWRKGNYPELKYLNLTPTLINLHRLDSYHQDFVIFFEQSVLTDTTINNVKCHKLLVETRTGLSISKVEEVLQKRSTEVIQEFMYWVYGQRISQKRKKKMVQSVCSELKIHDFEGRDLKNDISNLYDVDDNKKDFTIIVKNPNDEKDNIEIKVHKLILLIRSKKFLQQILKNDKNINSLIDDSQKSPNALKCLIHFFYTDQIIFKKEYNSKAICKELLNAQEYFQLNNTSKLPQLIEENN